MATRNELTEAQRAFCGHVAAGKNTVEAHRLAFPHAKSTDATRKREAMRWLKQGRFIQLVEELRGRVNDKMAETIRVTRELVIAELWDNAQRAKQAVPVRDREGKETGEYVANFAASNQALIALGNEIGMFGKGKKGDEDDALDGLSDEQVRALKQLADELNAADPAGAARVVGKPQRH